ncbi:MAG: site-specific integrase [Alcaligenaceae bacterium]|nr:MAG: site-specific integrase [Alcaligenaceae bacterium]
MPKIARELTALEISRLRKQGDYTVGGVPGLHFQIDGQARSWFQRYQVAHVRRKIGLGTYPAMSLAQAREKARAVREQVAAGIDPTAARDAEHQALANARARALTFDKAAEQFIAAREREWVNPKHRQQWENTLATYASPFIGSMNVAEIDQAAMLRVLTPIWHNRTTTATRLRGRIEQVLDYATVLGHRAGENPARWRGHLDKLLARPSKFSRVTHHPAVQLSDAPAVVRKIADTEGSGARALLLQVLTAGRSGEVRGAMWQEFDLDAAVWTIPAARMKAKKEHRVPLSKQAVALINAIPRVAGSAYLFPSRSSTEKPVSDMTLTAVMRRMNLDAVPHGFRSTFRDWAAECTPYPGDVVEMALAHTIANKVEAAYRRGDMLAKRAPLMQEWADYCLASASHGE